jgi:hypothetical protein
MGKKKYVERSAVLRIDMQEFKVTYDMKVTEVDEREYYMRDLERVHREVPLDRLGEILEQLPRDELDAYCISPDGNIILFYFYKRLR